MFSAKEFRAMARNKLKGNWLVSVLVSFVAALLGGVSGGGSGAASGSASGAAGSYSGASSSVSGSVSGSTDQLAGQLEQFLESNPILVATITSLMGIILIIGLALLIIGGAVELGHNKYYIDLCTNQQPKFETLFSRFGIFFKALGLRLFMGLFIFLWTLLLFIPGIIAAYRYSMAPYLMAQNPDMGIREAVNRSKELMQGRKWRLFCLELSFIGWHLLCILTFGLGYLFLNPYIQSAYAAFYLDASGQGIPM